MAFADYSSYGALKGTYDVIKAQATEGPMGGLDQIGDDFKNMGESWYTPFTKVKSDFDTGHFWDGMGNLTLATMNSVMAGATVFGGIEAAGAFSSAMADFGAESAAAGAEDMTTSLGDSSDITSDDPKKTIFSKVKDTIEKNTRKTNLGKALTDAGTKFVGGKTSAEVKAEKLASMKRIDKLNVLYDGPLDADAEDEGLIRTKDFTEKKYEPDKIPSYLRSKYMKDDGEFDEEKFKKSSTHSERTALRKAGAVKDVEKIKYKYLQYVKSKADALTKESREYGESNKKLFLSQRKNVIENAKNLSLEEKLLLLMDKTDISEENAPIFDDAAVRLVNNSKSINADEKLNILEKMDNRLRNYGQDEDKLKYNENPVYTHM
jgi:hypothetical protein